MTTMNDRRMMLDQDKWPVWPYLPLKRKNNSLEDKNLGVLFADQQYADAKEGKGKFTIYMVYLFALPKTRKEWEAAPRLEYNTIDDLLKDDWIVD